MLQRPSDLVCASRGIVRYLRPKHSIAAEYAAYQTVAVDVPGAGTYEYDDNGNRVRFNAADGSVQRYVYDRENRLTTIYYDATASLPRSEFDYDGLGRRIATRESTSSETPTSDQNFLYDGVDLVEVRDTDDDLRARYIHGPGIDNPLVLLEFDALGDENARYFYHADHLGSIRALTNTGGTVAESYDYSAYGRPLHDPTADTTLNAFTYTGREYHVASGLYFYRARFYDAAVGTFLSRDPIGLAGGINGYAYALGTPTLLTDPTGLDAYLIYYNDVNQPYGHLSIAVDVWNADGSYAGSKEFYFRAQSMPKALGYYQGEVLISEFKGVNPADGIDPQQDVRVVRIPTGKEQDEQILQAALDASGENTPPYNVSGNNCVDYARDALAAGGITIPTYPKVPNNHQKVRPRPPYKHNGQVIRDGPTVSQAAN